MKDKEHCCFRRAICHTPWSFLNQTRRVFFARLQCFRRVQIRASYAEACPNCYVALLDKLQKWICTTDGLSLAASLEPLAHCRNVVSLNLLWRYFFGSCSSELVQLVALPCFWGRSTRYLDRLYDFSITIPRCCKDVYFNSFSPSTAKSRNYLPKECFSLTYDISGFNSRVNSFFLTAGFFWRDFWYSFNSIPCCGCSVLHGVNQN